MALLDIVLLLVVAAVCGIVAQVLVGYSYRGILTSIVLGFIGAVLGTFLCFQFDLPRIFTVELVEGKPFPVVWSIIGSVLLLAVLNLLTGGRARRK